MAHELLCPHGHRWQIDEDRTRVEEHSLCPTCGSHALQATVVGESNSLTTEIPGGPAANDVTSELQVSGAPAAGSENAGANTQAMVTADLHPSTSPQGGEGRGIQPLTLDVAHEVTAENIAADNEHVTLLQDERAGLSVPGYEIVAELGRGGMGVVYKARQQGLNRVVALKMVLHGGHASPQQLARFRREAEAIAQLRHPNIVQIYDVGEHDGCPYFSLEFVEGRDLASKIDGTPQPPREAARIVQQVAGAMAAAHQLGIIHRDLKPANILLTTDGVPKVTDFGLAKRLEDSDDGATRSGAVIGTPSYMAPEQASGKTKHAGPAADIYALGAILYDLLTGRPPFQGETLLDTLQMVQKSEPVPPIRLQSKLPRDLDVICLKALQKDPRRRYATSDDLGEDLRRFLAGEPIRARPTPVWEHAFKWARRHPAAASLMAVSLLLIVTVLTLGGLWLDAARKSAQQREQQQAQLALINRQRADEQSRLRALEEKATAEAVTQRDRAEQNFRLARAAVDEMLTRVGQAKLKHEPRMERIRRELLDKALQFYDRFLKMRSDDPAVRWEAARAQQRVADIYAMLGQYTEAERANRSAQQQFETLAADDPKNLDYLHDLGVGWNNLGSVLQATGRNSDAEAAYRQALTLRQKLTSRSGKTEHRIELAATYNDLALSLQKLGKLRDAEASFLAAQTVLQQLTRDNAERRDFRFQLALAHSNLGAVLTSLDETRRAQKSLETASSLLENLTLDSPLMPDYRQHYALCQHQIGDLLRDREPQRAESVYRIALQLFEQLVSDFPTVPAYRHDLATTYANLAVLLQATGRQQDADQAYETALALRRKNADDFPTVPDFRFDLASGYNNRGILLHTHNRLKEAEAAYREAETLFGTLVRKHPDAPEYQQELAGICLNLATLLSSLGQPVQAEKICLQAIDLQSKLATKFPLTRTPLPRGERGTGEGHSYLAELATMRRNLGSLKLINNDPAGAEKAFRSALADFTALVERVPNVPDYRFQLAISWKNVADVLRDLKRDGDAEPALRSALNILTGLHGDYPEMPLYRQQFGSASNGLAILLATTGRAPEAEKVWRQAVQVQQTLLDESPGNADYCRELIVSHSNLGALLRELDRPLEAEKSQLRVLELRELLVKAHPKAAVFRVELGSSLQEIARLHLKAGKPANARPLLRKAVDHLRTAVALHPAEAAIHQHLYVALTNEMEAALGDQPQVMKLAQQLSDIVEKAKIPGARWEHQRIAALLARCALAVEGDSKLDEKTRTTRASACRDQAMIWLHKAVDNGLREFQQLQSAPEFEALRNREDFRKLVLMKSAG